MSNHLIGHLDLTICDSHGDIPNADADVFIRDVEDDDDDGGALYVYAPERAAVAALLAPEPEPSDAEVEDDEVDAAGEAIWASIIGPRSNVPWDRQPRDMQARYRIAGRSALQAARAARQTGGAE